MIYINSYADAKAECDVCCTSANAEKIAMEMPGDELIFVPDLFFAQNLEKVLKEGEKSLYHDRYAKIYRKTYKIFNISLLKVVTNTR